jgi:hypothetical protein
VSAHPFDCPPEIAAAIERAESVEHKGAILSLVMSVADSKSRVAVLECCLLASVLINCAAIAVIVGLSH